MDGIQQCDEVPLNLFEVLMDIRIFTAKNLYVNFMSMCQVLN